MAGLIKGLNKRCAFGVEVVGISVINAPGVITRQCPPGYMKMGVLPHWLEDD